VGRENSEASRTPSKKKASKMASINICTGLNFAVGAVGGRGGWEMGW